jgi:glycosyltransferase involved in cell wall biosynthesis
MLLTSIKHVQRGIHIKFLSSLKEMKIYILGSYAGTADEAMANISYHIYCSLRTHQTDVTFLNACEAKYLKFWKLIIRNRPAIVHYITAPTLKQLVFLKIIQLLTRSKTVVSATQSVLHRSRFFRMFSFLLKPDVVLVQSQKSEAFFNKIGFKNKFVQNGVDLERFIPLEEQKKNTIRKRFGFDEEDFIILHVGPISHKRNQRALVRLGSPSTKVLLIVSITNPSDSRAYEELSESKISILKEYFPNIEEIYGMVDVYVWPVFNELAGVEIPLSILEAMSCNLPVVTTKYGALSRVFQQGNGLFFIDKEKEIDEIISILKRKDVKVDTRQKVEIMSWTAVVHTIIEIYESIYNIR